MFVIYTLDMEENIIKHCIGFDWDEGNRDKSLNKHNISFNECEQVFFNEPLLMFEDEKHSQAEKRIYVLGKTDGHKKLFIAFTVRNKLIRVISARPMSKKERGVYEQI